MLLEEISALKLELATIRTDKQQAFQDFDANLRNDAVDFELSEASHHQSTSSGSGSLLATMSNMSLSSLNIPECKPSKGETDIDKKAYEHWKEILSASFNLVHATDEQAKMDIFRIKAGPKLLEVMQGTSSTAEMPDPRNKPFSNALARLDNYYGSRTYIIGQRGKLMNMVQQSGESSVSFVRRVSASAKLCGYKTEEEMEAVVRTIVKGTIDSRVRVLAHRNWVNQGDVNSLIALVHDREMEILNEEEYQKVNRQNTVTIAAVTQSADSRAQFRRGTGSGYRGIQRGRGAFHRGRAHYQGPSRKACWRCASIYHDASGCPNIDKVCHNCKRRGHLARSCTLSPQVAVGHKRTHTAAGEGEPVPKIAAITQSGEEDEVKVMEAEDIE